MYSGQPHNRHNEGWQNRQMKLVTGMPHPLDWPVSPELVQQVTALNR